MGSVSPTLDSVPNCELLWPIKCGRSEAVPVWAHPLSFDCFLFDSFEMQPLCKSAGAGLLNGEKTLREGEKSEEGEKDG